MKKKLFYQLATGLLISCLLFSCEQQNFTDPQNENIEFTFNLNAGHLKSSPDSCESLSYATKIVLTIETITGEETDYTDTELELYKLNGSFFSPKLALLVGEYRLTKLLLIDDYNNVLFAAPLEGSQLAQNVQNPLPIEFNVIKDKAISVNVEVVCALNYAPEDFGLVSFWFSQVKALYFLVTVSELGQNLILDADLTVTSGDYSYNQHLEAVANNVVTVREGLENYTLLIEKEGYQPFEQLFSNAELNEFSDRPLVVELMKIKKPLHDPVLVVQFESLVDRRSHHITSDGHFFYTIEGGGFTVGSISKYTLEGVLIARYSNDIDGRGLSYNKPDGSFYASLYTGDIVKITSIEDGLWEMVYENKLQNYQTSFAISPDGQYFYDLYSGDLKIWNFITGQIVSSWTGIPHGTTNNWDGDACVAVDEDYIYAWDASEKEIYVYDRFTVEPVTTIVVPYGSNGMSLSVFDGYLFVGEYMNYGRNIWYGYNIRNEIAKSTPVFNNLPSSNKLDEKINEKGSDFE